MNEQLQFKTDFLNDLILQSQLIEKSNNEYVLNNYYSIINIDYTQTSFIFNFIDYEGYANLQNNTNSNINKHFVDLLSNFIKLQTDAKLRNKLVSCDFNMLRLFNINEPTHSFLLANILNPNSEHGQGNLFLYLFLKMIGIEAPEIGQWTVTAEKGRIDILLKRANPHSVVVIENKSNNAIDQENQLYRYWYQEIYYPNRHRDINYTGLHPEKYQILYLTPSDWKQPSNNSLIKPLAWPSELPNSIPLKPLIWKFDTEIIEWLSNILDEIPKENYRLTEYIKQYIEFWK